MNLARLPMSATLRALWRRRRGQTVLAWLLWGMALATATASFALLHALLWSPLPYHDDGRLYWVWSVRPDVDRAFFSPPDLADFRQRSRTAQAIAGLTPFESNLRRDGQARRIQGLRVTANFFATLGVAPLYGRLLGDRDDLAAARVLVIDWPLFLSELDGDRARIGQTLDLDGVAYQVVGVMPPEFVFPGAGPSPSFAAPMALSLEPRRDNRGANFIRLLIRTLANADRSLLEQELADLSAELAEQYPASNAMKLAPAVVPLRQEMAGRQDALLAAVLAASALLLGVIALNLGALQLLSLRQRRPELALRHALGGSTWQQLSPLVAELLWLAGVGSLIGLLLAQPMLATLRSELPATGPRLATAAVGGPELMFGLAAAAAMTMLVALPSWLALRAGGAARAVRAAAYSADRRFGSLLLAGQLGLTCAVVTALAAALSTWHALAEDDLGFDPRAIASLRISLPAADYGEPARLLAKVEQLLAVLRAAGLEAAAASALPLSQINSRVDFELPGFSDPRPGFVPTAQARWVTPDYLALLGIEHHGGRRLEASDHASAEPVVVVDRALAERYWKAGEVLSSSLTVAAQPATRVVGVVDNVPHFQQGEPHNGTLYLPLAQLSPRYTAFVAQRFHLLARGPGSAAHSLQRMRSSLLQHDPLLAPSLELPLQAYVDGNRRQVLVAIRLLGLQAVAAALLSALGAFALAAAGAQARRRELAIRAAIGADSGRLQRQLLGDSIASVLAGLTAGSLLAWAAATSVRGALGPAAQLDPRWVLPGIAALLLLTLAAAWWPSRRAARLPPLQGLRDS